MCVKTIEYQIIVKLYEFCILDVLNVNAQNNN